MKWKVCPIQGRQLLDVREEDLFGDFRLCDTYRGGGGYDQFPKIFKKRTGSDLDVSKQFVVQLYGCPLRCPYCYVTRDGVFGKYKHYTTEELLSWFEKSNLNVFHLMGGAPALYIEHWADIVDILPDNKVFHSDLLLFEKDYKSEWFKPLVKKNVLLALNIKGVHPEDMERNTGLDLTGGPLRRYWKNFHTLVESGVNFYITYTNPDKKWLSRYNKLLENIYGSKILDDHYVIDLIEYDALKTREATAW